MSRLGRRVPATTAGQALRAPILAAALLTALGGATTVRADAAGDLCLTAIEAAEARHGWLPEGLLRAMALVESGRVVPGGAGAEPWPWAVNSPAGSFYPASLEEAVAKVEELQAQGVTNIDVGCLQVNLHHHPNAFSSLEEAFEPAANVAYAARFLTALEAEGASTFGAVGRYHSRTPVLGVMYARKVFARWGYQNALRAAGAG